MHLGGLRLGHQSCVESVYSDLFIEVLCLAPCGWGGVVIGLFGGVPGEVILHLASPLKEEKIYASIGIDIVQGIAVARGHYLVHKSILISHQPLVFCHIRTIEVYVVRTLCHIYSKMVLYIGCGVVIVVVLIKKIPCPGISDNLNGSICTYIGCPYQGHPWVYAAIDGVGELGDCGDCVVIGPIVLEHIRHLGCAIIAVYDLHRQSHIVCGVLRLGQASIRGE